MINQAGWSESQNWFLWRKAAIKIKDDLWMNHPIAVSNALKGILCFGHSRKFDDLYIWGCAERFEIIKEGDQCPSYEIIMNAEIAELKISSQFYIYPCVFECAENANMVPK